MTQLAAFNWLGLAVFSGLILVCVLYFLVLSGHFPQAFQKPEMQVWHGRLLLGLSIVIIALAAANAFGIAANALPGPVAIIAAGTVFLAAPLVLQRLPVSFIDGRRGIATLGAIAVLLLLLANKLKL